MYKVIGVRASSFKPQDRDETIEGLNLYCVYNDDKIRGFGCERFFVTYRKFVDGVVPNPEDEIQVTFNRYGKVDSVTVIPKAK